MKIKIEIDINQEFANKYYETVQSAMESPKFINADREVLITTAIAVGLAGLDQNKAGEILDKLTEVV